jgi:hypothetical protein
LFPAKKSIKNHSDKTPKARKSALEWGLEPLLAALSTEKRMTQNAPATALDTTINLDAMTPELIAQAATDNDLNSALRLLQKAAGITTGDVAGIAFSDRRGDDDWWPAATLAERTEALLDYKDIEGFYLRQGLSG